MSIVKVGQERVRKSRRHKPDNLTAANLIKGKEFPRGVIAHFNQWLGDKDPTKRQARKFLDTFPKYRG